jgi:hypothetical protein
MNAIAIKAVGLLTTLVVATHGNAAFGQKIAVKSGNFKTWIFGTESIGGGTGMMAITKALGDPPPALVCTTTTGAGQIGGGYGIDTTVTTSAPLEGRSFTLKLVFLSGLGAYGAGQAVGLEVAQNGNVYGLQVGVTNTSTSWQPLTFTGTLQSAGFVQIAGSGPATPDFTGGVPTQFGLGAGNEDMGTVTNYYDKFSLIVK